ncbi:zinc finger BED domain-containing protein 1-like, partial [Anoplophora glabripennis]|uniref:zinc finger BED domain-containing protein 1-like n=1 Tax=Anoplophora glabripennis TaxID=217634 RepID=UPI0008736C04
MSNKVMNPEILNEDPSTQGDGDISIGISESADVDINNCDTDTDITSNMSTNSNNSHISEVSAAWKLSSVPQPSRYSQPLVSESFDAINSYSGGEKSQRITSAIIFMIVKDNMPLNSTDKEGFKHLMKTIAPLYKIPGRNSITKLIDTKYEVLSLLIKNKLSEVENITLTTDVWTEILNTVGFLGVTAHFYFDNKLNSIAIGVYELSENHTGDYLGNCLRTVCEEWNIPLEKITAVVTDNGSNIVKAVSNVFGKNKHLPCFAHTLDLVASKIVYETEEVRDIVSKIKSIVTHFKQSVIDADKLRKAQGKDFLKLIQSVPTRWNSVYYMLERFLKLSTYIAPILLENSKGPSMIQGMEIEIVREVLQILKPIEQVSKEICGEQYLTGSKIIPIINCLFKTMQHLDTSTEEAKKLLTCAIKELKHRFGVIEQVRLLAIATLLDPRFKKLHFNDFVACSQAVKCISNICKEYDIPKKSVPAVETTEKIHKSDSVWAYHVELAKNSIDIDIQAEKDEGTYCDLKTYFKQPIEPLLTTDVFLFWKSVM